MVFIGLFERVLVISSFNTLICGNRRFTQKNRIRILGELAYIGSSCGGISLKRDKCHLQLTRLGLH